MFYIKHTKDQKAFPTSTKRNIIKENKRDEVELLQILNQFPKLCPLFSLEHLLQFTFSTLYVTLNRFGTGTH